MEYRPGSWAPTSQSSEVSQSCVIGTTKQACMEVILSTYGSPCMTLRTRRLQPCMTIISMSALGDMRAHTHLDPVPLRLGEAWRADHRLHQLPHGRLVPIGEALVSAHQLNQIPSLVLLLRFYAPVSDVGGQGIQQLDRRIPLIAALDARK